jgi:hypothetical protein
MRDGLWIRPLQINSPRVDHSSTKEQTMKNADAIRAYVLDQYIETGRRIFVSDLMEQFNTNAVGIRNALGYDDFVFEHDDKWSGSNYAGKYIQAACVEPNKAGLIKFIKQLRSTT